MQARYNEKDLMNGSQIKIKGIDNHLHIQVPESSLDELKRELETYIKQNAKFLEGAKIVLELGKMAIKSSELFEIKNLMLDNQLSISQIISENEITRHSAELLGLKIEKQKQSQIIPENVLPVNTNISGENAMFISRTLRSGSTVYNNGHIVIMGDVNPGAIITAGGNIVVWGKLKGEAHAGSVTKNSVICALELAPTYLSIGDISLQETRKKLSKQPEQALLVNQSIIITAWKGK